MNITAGELSTLMEGAAAKAVDPLREDVRQLNSNVSDYRAEVAELRGAIKGSKSVVSWKTTPAAVTIGTAIAVAANLLDLL